MKKNTKQGYLLTRLLKINQLFELQTRWIGKGINVEFMAEREAILQTARKMHREEVEEAYNKGFDDGFDDHDSETLTRNINYYSQTFETP